MPYYDYAGFVGAGVTVVFALFSLAISIAFYVLQSVSFYSIAKRRCIKHPWLAWVPVGNMWILGCISDQYQYVVKRKVKNKRKALLILEVLTVPIAIVFVVMIGSLFAGILMGMADMFGDNSGTETINTLVAGSTAGMLLSGLVMSGLSIALAVIEYIALYDLYSSCDAYNNVLYLILSILFSGLLPLFLFLCRNKDEGMPPRKQPAAEPEWQPQPPREDPWENT